MVAEGIEGEAQRDELWSMGCGLGQGYLYSRPVPAADLLSLLNAGRALGGQAPGSGGRVTRISNPAFRPVQDVRWADLQRLRSSSPMYDAVI